MGKIAQEYTGTWIPAIIMLNEKLTPTEKMLYAEIASFRQCFASNEWLSTRLGVSVRTVQTGVKKLTEMRLISNFESEGRRICVAAVQNLHPPHEKSAPIKQSIEHTEKPAGAGAVMEKELLANLNEVTGRTFRTLPPTAKKTLKHFSVAEIRQALDALAADSWHKNLLGKLSSDYLLRLTTIEKFFVDGVAGIQGDGIVITPIEKTDSVIDKMKRGEI